MRGARHGGSRAELGPPPRNRANSGCAAAKQSRAGACRPGIRQQPRTRQYPPRPIAYRPETEQIRGVSPRNRAEPGRVAPESARNFPSAQTRPPLYPRNHFARQPPIHQRRMPGFALDRRPATDNLMVYGCGVEQLVARRAHNPEVVGSSPTPATSGPVTNVTGPLVLTERRRETSAAFLFSTPVPAKTYESAASLAWKPRWTERSTPAAQAFKCTMRRRYRPAGRSRRACCMTTVDGIGG